MWNDGTELYHYGIAGMKWGVRNGPPYPLGSERKTKLEKTQTYQDKNYGTKKTEARSSIGKAAAEKLGNKTFGELDPVWIELGVYSVLSLITVAAVSVAVKREEKARKQEQEDNRNKHGKFSDLKMIDGAHTEDEDMAAINPGFGYNAERMSNCALCTATYELRRRGYDVEAGDSTHGRMIEECAAWFNVPKNEYKEIANYEALKAKLKSMPNGSRGNLAGPCGVYGSGHSMVWEKVDGKIIVRDCQSGKMYNSLNASPITKTGTGFYCYRTDNKQVNTYLIMDAIAQKGTFDNDNI